MAASSSRTASPNSQGSTWPAETRASIRYGLKNGTNEATLTHVSSIACSPKTDMK